MEAGDAVGLLLTQTGVDPNPAYVALHAHGPILQVGDAYYFVSGYEAVDRVLRDPGMDAYDPERLDRQWDDWRDNAAVALFADDLAPRSRRRTTRTVTGSPATS